MEEPEQADSSQLVSQNNEKIKELTTALMSAMGMKSESASQKMASASVFLVRLFKKNITGSPWRINEVRMKRLNGFFYRLCNEFPSEKTAVEVIYHLILAFIEHSSVSQIDYNLPTINICGWIGKVLGEICKNGFSETVLSTLQVILSHKRYDSISAQKFEELIKSSEYFRELQIKKNEENEANKGEHEFSFFEEKSIIEYILQKLPYMQLFKQIFVTSEDKTQIAKLFLDYCRRVQIADISQSFAAAFIDSTIHTKQTITAILTGLDSELFDLEQFDQNCKNLFRQVKIQNNKKILYSAKIKDLKCENRLIELMIEDARNQSVDELVSAFVSELSCNNFYILYLIDKAKLKLPQKYIYLPLQQKTELTNRRAIISCLAIIQNRTAHKKLIAKFLADHNKMKISQKINILKHIFFAFYEIPKSHLLTQIIKSISVSALDSLSHYEFLPDISQYQKSATDKQEREMLTNLMQIHYGNDNEVFKLKLQLHLLAGINFKYMNDLNSVTAMFENLNQEMLVKVKSIPHHLLQVVMMGLNNKLNEQYMFNCSQSGDLVNWAMSIYKKEFKQFLNAVEDDLKARNMPWLSKFLIELFEFNVQRKQDIVFLQQLRHITDTKSIERLNGLNFSQYFLNQQVNKPLANQDILKSKTLILEMREFIKSINVAKYPIKKEIRVMINEDTADLRAIRIIRFMNDIQLHEKNLQIPNFKLFIDSIMSELKPEFDFFDGLEKKAVGIQIEYYSIYQCLPFLLTINYAHSLEFIATMLQSKTNAIADDKKKKPKKKKQASELDLDKDKLTAVLLKKQSCIFGDLNSLQSFDCLIKIINQLKGNWDQIQLATQLSKWVSKIKMFHKSKFEDWAAKISSLVRLWEFAQKIIVQGICSQEIQRQFFIFNDLFNTLQEKYRNEPNYVEVERQLLRGIFILYRLDCVKNSESSMLEQCYDHIPKDKVNDSLALIHPKETAESCVLYCYDCEKRACQVCARLFHKNHAIIFRERGSQTDCPHSVKKQDKSSDRRNRILERQKHAAKEVAMRELARSRDRRSSRSRDKIEREMEKYWIKARIEGLRQADLGPPEHLIGWRRQILDKNKRDSRQDQQSQIFDFPHPDECQSEQIEEKQSKEESVKECPEKQYLARELLVSQPNSFEPVFELGKIPRRNRKAKINLSILFSILLRELKNDTFITGQNIEIAKEGEEKSDFNAQVSTAKFLIFKSDVFKPMSVAIQARAQPYGYSSSPDLSALFLRNTISINQNLVAVAAGSANQIVVFGFQNLRNKFLKKQAQKKHKDAQQMQSNVHSQNRSPQQPVMQISLCPHSKQILAIVCHSKINFEYISYDSRFQKIPQGDLSLSGPITKFKWIKGLKHYFSYLSREVFIVRMAKSRESEKRNRITIGKAIRDYDLLFTSQKTLIIVVLDQEGKIYRAKVDYINRHSCDLSDRRVIMEYQSSNKIESVCCYSYFVICTTSKGSLIILNFDEENNLLNSPMQMPVAARITTHEVSSQCHRLKEVSKINSLRVITRTQSDLFLACLLCKQQKPTETKRSGSFAIISLNYNKKSCNVEVFNDHGLTNSYDFQVCNDKDYIFFCHTDEGEIWSCRFSPYKSTLNENEFKINLTNDKVSEYAKTCKSLNIFDSMKYCEQRKQVCFKIFQQITDKYQITLDNTMVLFESIKKQKYQYFPTGISLLFTPKNPQKQVNLKLNFMGNNYNHIIRQKKQIQFPLTIKESLMFFLDVCPIEITYLEGKEQLVVTSHNIYGIKWQEKTPYLDALKSVMKLVEVYMKYPKQSIEHFCFNENRIQVGEYAIEEIQAYLSKQKYSVIQGNLLLKLQLLREALDLTKADESMIKQVFQDTRDKIYPNCLEKSELKISIHKLFYKVTAELGADNMKKLGHPHFYYTQLDIYEIFRLYKIFKDQQTIESYEYFLRKLVSVLNNRTLNAYIILSLYPQLIQSICTFYRKIIVQFKRYFKISDCGIDNDDKERLNDLCKLLIRILCEFYQLQKNKERVINAQASFLQTMEFVFCINNKQIYKQVDLNPFQYMEYVFPISQHIIRDLPLNFMTIQAIECLEEKSNSAKIQEEKVQSQQPHLRSSGDGEQLSLKIMWDQILSDESQQEHKQPQEQNEMIDDYYMPMLSNQKEQANDMEEKLIEQQDQWQGNERIPEIEDPCSSLTDKSTINYNRIFQYLLTKSKIQTTQQVTFAYYGLCENLLITILKKRDISLTVDNSVFYVGLVYNILMIIQKKLKYLFGETGVIDMNNNYLTEYLLPIIEAIDQEIRSSTVSIIYMVINKFVEVSYEDQEPVLNSCYLGRCFVQYYLSNPKSNEFLKAVSTSDWHPKDYIAPASMTSVFSFEYFALENPVYQLQFIGSLYQSLRLKQMHQLTILQKQIKQAVLKVVVKFELRIYINIMIIEKWSDDLQKTKINVAFEKIDNKPIESLMMIKQSISKMPAILQQDFKSDHEKISKIEDLLGSGSVSDTDLLVVLNKFYSEES